MAITELKFEASEFTGQDVASLPDRPGSAGITAAELKARFDNVGKAMLALGRYNALIDALIAVADGASGARQIGATGIPGLTGENVQALLEALAAQLETKQALLHFDEAPSAGSENPVTSGGVYTLGAGKVDKVSGKGLSQNDYTDAEKSALAAAAAAAHGHENKALLDRLSDSAGEQKFLNGAGQYVLPPAATAAGELLGEYRLAYGAGDAVKGELLAVTASYSQSWQRITAGTVLTPFARIAVAAEAASPGVLLRGVERGCVRLDCGALPPNPAYEGPLYIEGQLAADGAFTVITPRTCELREGYDYWFVGSALTWAMYSTGGAERHYQDFSLEGQPRLIFHQKGGHFTALNGVPLSLGDTLGTATDVSITGLLKGRAGKLCAAVEGADYLAEPRVPAVQHAYCAGKPLLLTRHLNVFNQSQTAGLPCIFWPWLIRVDDKLSAPLGKYYLYFSTDHAATGTVALAYADSVLGPYTYYGPVLSGQNCESPSVMWDELNSRLLLYAQSPQVYAGEAESTLHRTSTDGISWSPPEKTLTLEPGRLYVNAHNGYFHPFRIGGQWGAYSLMGGGNGGAALHYSQDGVRWVTDHSQLGYPFLCKKTLSGVETEYYMPPHHGTPVTKWGQSWLLGEFMNLTSGAEPKNASIAMGLLSGAAGFVGRPYEIVKMRDDTYESADIRSVSVYEEGGRLYVWYACKLAAGSCFNVAVLEEPLSGAPLVSEALCFTDSSSFNLPDMALDEAIAPIDVSSGATGGALPYSFTASGLPAGVVMSAAGLISGVPTVAAGPSSAVLTVTDAEGESASITVSVGGIAPVWVELPTSSTTTAGSFVRDYYDFSPALEAGTYEFYITLSGAPGAGGAYATCFALREAADTTVTNGQELVNLTFAGASSRQDLSYTGSFTLNAPSSYLMSWYRPYVAGQNAEIKIRRTVSELDDWTFVGAMQSSFADGSTWSKDMAYDIPAGEYDLRLCASDTASSEVADSDYTMIVRANSSTGANLFIVSGAQAKSATRFTQSDISLAQALTGLCLLIVPHKIGIFYTLYFREVN